MPQFFTTTTTTTAFTNYSQIVITSNSRGAVDREFVYIELETSFSPFFSFFVLFFFLSLFLPSFWCLLCHSCEERQLWCSLVWPTEEFCTPHCLTPLILLLSLFIYLFIIITIVIITMTCQHATSTTLPWRSCTRWTQSSYLVVANTYIFWAPGRVGSGWGSKNHRFLSTRRIAAPGPFFGPQRRFFGI